MCTYKNKTHLTWETWDYWTATFQKKIIFPPLAKTHKRKKSLFRLQCRHGVVHKWFLDIAGKHNQPLFSQLVSLQGQNPGEISILNSIMAWLETQKIQNALNDKERRNNWSNEESASANRCNISSCQLIITPVRCITFIPVDSRRMMTRKKNPPKKRKRILLKSFAGIQYQRH